TSTPASTSRRGLALRCSSTSGFVGKFGAEDVRRQMDPLDDLACSALFCDAEYDDISKDVFDTSTRGEEIE
nr:hypothetical protein [Tanacetum cinerariifolium]